MVIPVAARDRAGLRPGTLLEVTVDELGVRLEPRAPGPRLVRVGRRLVARPTVTPDEGPAVDLAALVEDERNRSRATVIVTDNRRHFTTALRHGIRVETAAEFVAAMKRGRR